ncbi:MAG TPA: hypothetical protein VFN61_08965 [Acidimicrobiales bacterium]|nr:hypothetical protein [Acidimicrobiales bacterium]
MHELSTAEELASKVRHLAAGRRVLEVFARCPVTVDADEVTECFGYVVGELSATEEGSHLAEAALICETVPVPFQCACGFCGEIGADYVAGHTAVCPACGLTSEADASIVVVGISYASPAGASSPDRDRSGVPKLPTFAPAGGDQVP